MDVICMHRTAGSSGSYKKKTISLKHTIDNYQVNISQDHLLHEKGGLVQPFR